MTTDSESTALTLAEILFIMDMSAYQLAKKAGVTTGTVMRAAVVGSPFKTNDTSMECIAQALGLKVEDIVWVNGTSNKGRPAGSGSEVRRPHAQLAYKTCPKHHVQLPASGICDECAA